MKRKRILCGVLAVCLVSAMSLPECVFAETAAGSVITADETAGAGIGRVSVGAGIESVGVGERDAVSVQSYEELVQALENASTDKDAPTVLELAASIDLTAPVTVKENTYVILASKSGNAYSLNYTGAALTRTNEAVLTVNGTLTVKNAVVDAQYKGRVCCIGVNISGAEGSYAGTVSLGDGAVIQNGSGGNSAYIKNGLGIWLSKGSPEYHAALLMEEGSKVCGCRSYGAVSVNGIGVSVQDYGVFEMRGGEICDNADVGTGIINSPCASGGGVSVSGSGSLFRMTNGSISKNSVCGDGAGLSLSTGGATAVLSGTAKITDNQASVYEKNSNSSGGRGGGAYISNGTLIIEENAQISSNTASTALVSITNGNGSRQLGSGGGIYLYQGEVQQNGGTVTNNKAECMYEGAAVDAGNYALANGGGVCVEQGTYTLANGSISGNTVTSTLTENSRSGNGGGVYVGFTASTGKCVSGRFLCNGGEIVGNTAQSHGSGVYIENTARIETSSMGGSTAMTLDAYASPEFCISGNAVITGNGSAGNQEDFYLPKTAVDGSGTEYPVFLTVSGELASQADIRLSVEQAKEDLAVAGGTDSYYIKEEDLARITFCNEESAMNQYELDLNHENQVVLAVKKNRDPIKNGSIVFVPGETDTYETAYDGEAKRPPIKVLFEGKELVPGQDYTVAYYQNQNAGAAKVTVFGKGAYKGTLSAGFTITPYVVTDEEEDFSIAEVPEKYQTGGQITPEVTVRYKGVLLEKDTDYTVSYGENTASGTGTVTVTCMDGSNFTGSKTVAFSIRERGKAALVHNESELMQAIRDAGSVISTEPDAAASVNADTASVIILANDIALTLEDASGDCNAVTLSAADNICLYGNGHTLSMADSVSLLPTEEEPEKSLFVLSGNGDSGSRLVLSDILVDGGYHGRLFYVEEGAALTLEDTAALQKGRISTKSSALYKGHFIYNAGTAKVNGAALSNLASAYNGAVYNDTTGSLTIEEGAVFENLSAVSGGALINAGRCELNGGVFWGCNGSSSYGAAITNLKGASFVMNSGKITGSNCTQPAVYNAGEFTMNAGEISENRNIYTTISFSGGGTVSNQGTDAVFTMHGGSICKNTAYTAGGGIFVYSGCVLVDGENALISDNQAFYELPDGSNKKLGYANGGGIFVYGSNAEVTLKAGKICNNTAGFDALPERLNQLSYSANGGGVYVQSGVFRMEGGQISGNRLHAQSESISQHRGFGAAVYVNGGGTFEMGGGTIGGETQEDANQSDFENGGGVYIANANTSGVSGNAGFGLSGGKITDTIYMCANTYIDLAAVLPEDAVYRLYYELFSIGSVLVKYADTVESAQIQQSDAGHFIIDNYEDAKISVDAEARTISFGKIRLSDCEISMPTQTFTYTGREIKAPVIIKDMLGNDISSAVFCSYENNIGVGTAQVTLQGNGKTVEGEAPPISFEITPASVAQAFITLSKTEYTYEPGTAQYCPAVTVTWNGTLLSEGTDYDLEYSNNTGIGTATVTVKGKGNFNESADRTFTIRNAEKEPQTITAAGSYTKKYGTAPFTLAVSRTPADGGKLSYVSDNTSVANVDNNGKVTITGVGTAKITVTAAETAKYKGAIRTVTVNVAKGTQSFSGKTVYSKVYGNKAFVLNLKAKDKAKLTYKSANKKVVAVSSKGKVTIKGTGRTTITVTAAATANYEKAAKKITITVKPKKMAKPNVSSPAAKTLLLNWKKDAKGKGYQIQIAGDKGFTKNVKYYIVKGSSATRRKIKGLKAGKSYYVRIQSYQLVNGKALTGSYSKAVKIKIAR